MFLVQMPEDIDFDELDPECRIVEESARDADRPLRALACAEQQEMMAEANAEGVVQERPPQLVVEMVGQ